MRKAMRIDGRIILPPDPTDKEFAYAIDMHTPKERERLARELTSMLRWTVWRLKHPRLAEFLDAAYCAGLAIVGTQRF